MHEPPHELHRRLGPRDISFFIITVSTSRYEAMISGREYRDESGDLAEEFVRKSGYRVVGRALVKDDVDMIRSKVAEALEVADVVILTGGTGLARSDVTIEAIRPMFEKEVEGFGEIFRYVSYTKIGPAAIMSRATAGVVRGRLIICLPGSPNAVNVGLELIMSEVPHILYLVR